MKLRGLLLIAGLLAFTAALILLRFDVQPIGDNRIVHTDRLTGEVTICDETGCVKPRELRVPIGSASTENPLLKAWDEDQATKQGETR